MRNEDYLVSYIDDDGHTIVVDETEDYEEAYHISKMYRKMLGTDVGITENPMIDASKNRRLF